VIFSFYFFGKEENELPTRGLSLLSCDFFSSYIFWKEENVKPAEWTLLSYLFSFLFFLKKRK
jgi:hypothetical protein